MPSFSQRHQYAQPPEIAIREELPERLRRPIAEIAARHAGSGPFRQIVESVLNPYGLSPRPIQGLGWIPAIVVDSDLSAAAERLNGCPWYRVYDVVETVHRHLARQDKQSSIPVEGAPHAPAFEREINKYLVHVGVGWQLVDGKILTRGAEAFETAVKTAAAELQKDHRPTAAKQIHEALLELSARPDPNYRGAISMVWERWSALRAIWPGIKSSPLGRF